MRTALLLLVITPGLAFAQAGRFLLSAGEVTLVRAAQEIRPAAGAAVEPGDTIRVGPRSNVQIRMSDGSIISLRSDTVFRIDEYVYSGRGEDSDRSIFSLVRGGLRTVTGAIARRQSGAVLRTSHDASAIPPRQEKTSREQADPDSAEGESKMLGLIKDGLRAITGAVARPAHSTRHAVRLPTATLGVRGTHYTVVHCDNDCTIPGSTTPNGTYGGVSDGRIVLTNNAGEREFGAHEFFFVANSDSGPQSLIAPPGFIYDRLEGQQRARGQTASESTETMARSGLNAESRPSETPIPPAPASFIVAEQRTASGVPSVLPGGTTAPTAPATAFLAAFSNASGKLDTEGAFVDASALNTSGSIASQTLTDFSVPAGATINRASGTFSGSAGNVVNETVANALDAYWGSWSSGSVADASGTTTFLSGDKFHYLIGPNTPPEVVATKTGASPFQMIGGTTPTNNFGEPGSFSTSSMTLTVDFTKRSVAFPDTIIAFQSGTWSFLASPSPITIQPGGGAFVSNTASGTCTGICGASNPASLARTGIFMGPVADHLGVALQGRTLDGQSSMQATQIFSCAPKC